MKYVVVVLSILISLTVFSQKKSDKRKKIDKDLVGTWKGFESGHEHEETEKYWMQHRSEDGRFMLLMIYLRKYEEPKMVTIKGDW